MVVRFYHGLGDAVQMLQYASLLISMGGSVRYDVPSPLRPLLPFFLGTGPEVVPAEERDQSEIEAMELLFRFRTRVEDLPLARNYLRLPPSLVGTAGSRMGARMRTRVGVVWAGGNWDRERWIPVEKLQVIFERSDLELWNLQLADERGKGTFPRLRNAKAVCGTGLVALAATIANLDVLVTVDTLAAHLAGALGVPTYLLLKHQADWRWMGGETTEWYPSLRLFRQQEPGEWDAVVHSLGGALTAITQCDSVYESAEVDASCMAAVSR